VEETLRGLTAGRAGGGAFVSTMRKPIDEEVTNRETLQLQQRMAEIRNKLLAVSGKGGVGKSTVALGSAGAADALASSQGIEVVKT
jgi:Mrp family chromosome partitioning ATPase